MNENAVYEACSQQPQDNDAQSDSNTESPYATVKALTFNL